jgi:NTP pyrophosphatase (non-canonical NTP hydrolase)
MPDMTIKEFMRISNETAVRNGQFAPYWITTKIMLIVTELSEAVEEIRAQPSTHQDQRFTEEIGDAKACRFSRRTQITSRCNFQQNDSE